MFRKLMFLIAVVIVGAVPRARADGDLDSALASLNKYDWGSDRSVLEPIDRAVAASHNDPDEQRALEARLISALSSDISDCAKGYVCRQLSLIGSAQCVQSVAKLLPDKDLSHIARYALERIPDQEAVDVMRDSLRGLEGTLQIGVINSLGARRDQQSVDTLTEMLSDSDPTVVAAAAAALGSIGTAQAAEALKWLQDHVPDRGRLVAADAYLRCAEQLLKDGHKTDAMTIYRSLMTHQAKHIGLAARRGLLAATKQ